MHMNICNVPMYVSSGHSRGVLSVAFSPDGKTIVSGSGGTHGNIFGSGSEDNSIKMWNPETGDVIRTLNGNRDMLLCMYILLHI